MISSSAFKSTFSRYEKVALAPDSEKSSMALHLRQTPYRGHSDSNSTCLPFRAACLLTAGSNVQVLLAVFFWVSSMVKVHGKHPVRIGVEFLIELQAYVRMTACCACPGVGFIVIPFFCFLRMQDVARTSNSRISSVAEAQGRPGQRLPGPIT